MRTLVLSAILLSTIWVARTQEPVPAGKKDPEALNATIVAARKATAERRFADSEAMMAKVTADNPKLILPWVELGLAQLGLKKYPEAENSFKMALGVDPASNERAHSQDFYQSSDKRDAVAPTATRNTRNTVGGEVNNAQSRTPDIKGVSWASLGEIYVHEGKLKDALEAFDNAAASFPVQAAQYRRNETISFFQVGNSDAQLAAAEKAIALDPSRAAMYYFKGQALVSKATVDPKTQQMVLPPGCADAYQKYLELDPNGPYSADAKGVLAGAGIPVKAGKK
ncbi:tetratricopeptide repeat protein [Telmatobacter sp. DSM 110680]|uniref:Tetratricopeptide repeat protein n=1 Tax=Telmatobacter sp. DSM 110680 TaxID=3036704 RepID=A0AAU7DCM9_9BACT